MTVTLSLKKPIDAHGKQISELEFSEPTGADIAACGVPVDSEDQGGHTVSRLNTAAVAKYIARLANIPPSSVAVMSASDFMKSAEIVAGFFADMAKTS